MLRERLALHARHIPDLQRGVGMAVAERGGTAHWLHRMDGADPETAAHRTEGIAAFVVGAVRAILGDPNAKLLVIFPHRPPSPMARYEDALRCAVAFRSGRATSGSRSTPPCSTRPTRSGRRSPCGATARRRPSRRSTSARRSASARCAPSSTRRRRGAPSLGQAAGILGLSPRSLQRRLAGIDETWESLVEGWRRETAEAMLIDPDRRVGTAARRLRYGDPAHFDRAFRRWTGATPTVWRQDRIRPPADAD